MQVTRYFPYRTARVVGSPRLELPRDFLQELEHALAEAIGRYPENHSVYQVEGCRDGWERPPVYLWFTDSSVFIGGSVELRHPERGEAAKVITYDPPRLVRSAVRGLSA